jgi:hypothetical protein
MTVDERDELVRDLERIGVRVLAAEPRPEYAGELGGWQIRCWCEQPAHEYIITNAARFRATVHAGLIPDVPRGALD